MECCKRFVEKTFYQGDIICVYGVPKPMVGIIKAGGAKLVRLTSDGREIAVEYFEADNIFGEAFTVPGEYTEEMHVICTEEARIAFISYEYLLYRCKSNCPKHGEIMDDVLRMLAKKAVKLNERVQILGQGSIRGKLRCYVELMEAKCGKSSFTIPYSYSELADYLAVDRSAMMRELRNMEDEGEIKRNKRCIQSISKKQYVIVE